MAAAYAQQAPEPMLPWSSCAGEDKRFHAILRRVLLLMLLASLAIPWIQMPEPPREEAERLPSQLARVVLERTALQPPVAAAPPKQEQAPKPKDAVKPRKIDKTPPKKAVAKAREKARTVGVVAFSKELSSLRSSLDIAKLKVANTTRSGGAAKRTERSVLGRQSATATSGGIDTAALSADAGDTRLAAHTTGTVNSNIFGDGDGVSTAMNLKKGGRYTSSKAGIRDMESIRRVFEQHKGAIYAIYNRALRKNPELAGKFVFTIVIEPDGSISKIKLNASELGDSRLDRKLIARISMINFGKADAKATTVNYKFDFLPS